MAALVMVVLCAYVQCVCVWVGVGVGEGSSHWVVVKSPGPSPNDSAGNQVPSWPFICDSSVLWTSHNNPDPTEQNFMNIS